MKLICAWCEKTLEEGTGDPDEAVSHGMCSDCRKKFPKVLTKGGTQSGSRQ